MWSVAKVLWTQSRRGPKDHPDELIKSLITRSHFAPNWIRHDKIYSIIYESQTRVPIVLPPSAWTAQRPVIALHGRTVHLTHLPSRPSLIAQSTVKGEGADVGNQGKQR